MKNQFQISWLLKNKLALGRAPLNEEHIQKLESFGIKAILSLCSEDENNFSIDKNKFKFIRNPLPDHKHKKLINIEEIRNSISLLDELMIYGPTFVHCIGSVERSPLICMAWLINKEGLEVQESLDYLMSIHKTTNPLDSQIKVLYKL